MERFEPGQREKITPPQPPEQGIQAPGWETAQEVLAALDATPGLERADSQRALLSELTADRLVVRREDPEALTRLLSTGEPLSLSFTGGTPYANSVEWRPHLDGTRGLDNAYLEGMGQKDGVVTVYGFEPPEDFYFQEVDDSERVSSGVDRSRVRAAAGFVPREAVQFVTVRIPITAVPESEMSEEEKDQLYDFHTALPGKPKPLFVYRTYLRK